MKKRASVNNFIARDGYNNDHLLVRRSIFHMLFVGLVLLWIILMYYYASTRYFIHVSSTKEKYDPKLESILRNASMKNNNTIIITSLNEAWAKPVTWDQKAFLRCQALHPHCYQLETKSNNNDTSREAFFLTKDYLHIVWRKIEFLGHVLQMGYSFVFTDSDILWLRNPFEHFHEDADFQSSSDNFNGNSSSLNNGPNTGFSYVKSNEKTIWFYKFWFNSRKKYPNMHDQDVFNKIKRLPLISSMNLKIRFLSPEYFAGFCNYYKDLNKICTMHANCCVGLNNKINDLSIFLEDWSKYMALPQTMKSNKAHYYHSWGRGPRTCYYYPSSVEI
ncbi:hypothetical protein PIB30_039787 [Stylosanthes scabra]|uniref:Nucleotide-diphospho-sugar transferase domain-containing protein n=1 Tax=Stylosanthes scabra TaxID=79078 RepID=A0ABU6XC34_9FABA|nr:hypothetical protein [Stylosanthes scabra]